MARNLGLVLAFVISLPGLAHGQQDASVQGTVVDESKAVLPGVTITATDGSTGRQRVTTTDAQGRYLLPNLPPGSYSLQADLPGFATVVISNIELLVGQNATFGIAMKVAALEETVTVNAEAALVDTRSSAIADNVDRRQMEELPILGRNWLELALHVRGITANNIERRPGTQRQDEFQLNLDGQQVTQKVSGSDRGQPRFSREAVAEFQIVTNLFDITQGRSSGVQVQAITRSGTNTPHGSIYGNFRDDSFNAADHVAERVLPFENQQVGGSIGGPVVRDKMHFFSAYEYEREPNTVIAQPPQLPTQSFTFPSKRSEQSLLGRVDHSSMSARNRFMVRFSRWTLDRPFELGGTAHPSQALSRTQESTNVLGTWTRVFSERVVHELKVGYNAFDWTIGLAFPKMADTPQFVFPGLTVGGSRNYPQEFHQDEFSSRYSLMWNLDRHELKLGGEFIYWNDTGVRELVSRGEFIFQTRPSDLQRRFPAVSFDDPASWDLSGLDPLVLRFDRNFGDWSVNIPRPTWAVWFGDTWRATNRLTMNYGVRWDVDWGALSPPGTYKPATFDPIGGVAHNNPPFPNDNIGIQAGDQLFRTDMRDLNNVAPRAGFTYDVGGDGNLVIRGGSGLFYTVPISNVTYSQQTFNLVRVVAATFPNDGQAGFIQNPMRGVTADDILAGRLPLLPQQPRVLAHDYALPFAWQSAIGFQKQIGPAMGIEADLVYWKQYNLDVPQDINLFYDPATGYNKALARFGRPDPKYGQIQWISSGGRADYLALSSGLKRRFRNNFQFNVTHTLMFFKRDNTPGGEYSFFSFPDNDFDLDAEWARSSDFQRNTLRFSAIWELPFGFNVAGAYFYGSGNYSSTTVAGRPFGKAGVNRLNAGAPITVRPEARDRYEGPAIIGTLERTPRNALREKPLHKVDLRISKTFRIGGRVEVTGIAEVFNLFNHANFGSYNGQVNSQTFGNATRSLGNAYVPRSGQFGFRVAF